MTFNTRLFSLFLSVILTFGVQAKTSETSNQAQIVHSIKHQQSVTNEKTEIDALVRSWFTGFDLHKDASFFLSLLSQEFKITFPEQVLSNPSEFRSWLAVVDKFHLVHHEVLKIDVTLLSDSKASATVRVDWSAQNAGAWLFFPALQFWTLTREGEQWKINGYSVEQASEKKYQQNLALVNRYFDNFASLKHGFEAFEKQQASIIAKEIVTINDYDGQRFDYVGKAGFFTSIKDWLAKFSPQGDFSYEVINQHNDSVKLRVISDFTYNDQLIRTPNHCWIEEFKFNSNQEITHLSVFKHMDTTCAELATGE